MIITWLDSIDPRPTDEPLMALVSISGDIAYVSLLDDGVEHSVLLRKMVGAGADIEQYFRVIINSEGADWTFICPPGYKDISDRDLRIRSFFDDGNRILKCFMTEIGYPAIIEIPERYQRSYWS